MKDLSHLFSELTPNTLSLVIRDLSDAPALARARELAITSLASAVGKASAERLVREASE